VFSVLKKTQPLCPLCLCG